MPSCHHVVRQLQRKPGPDCTATPWDSAIDSHDRQVLWTCSGALFGIRPRTMKHRGYNSKSLDPNDDETITRLFIAVMTCLYKYTLMGKIRASHPVAHTVNICRFSSIFELTHATLTACACWSAIWATTPAGVSKIFSLATLLLRKLSNFPITTAREPRLGWVRNPSAPPTLERSTASRNASERI